MFRCGRLETGASIERGLQDEHTNMRKTCTSWAQVLTDPHKRGIYNDGNQAQNTIGDRVRC